jgi:chromosome segregation ATPase
MTVKRNVEGLRQNAQRKRQEALEKVEQGIRQLLKEGKPINFNTVTQVADVSKAFLYKEPEIKERIEQLRQQGAKKRPELKQKASDASKDAMIRVLRERIKKLEERNRELSRQNEVFGGQVLRVRELEQQVKRLQAENATARQPAASALSNCSVIETELNKLGVELNSTIKRLLREAPQEVIMAALQSLREALLENRADNPSGFFNRAVTDAWKPNEQYAKVLERNVFQEWFPIAQSRRLVIAATEIDGVQYVYTSSDTCVPFSEMLAVHPLEELRQ